MMIMDAVNKEERIFPLGELHQLPVLDIVIAKWQGLPLWHVLLSDLHLPEFRLQGVHEQRLGVYFPG